MELLAVGGAGLVWNPRRRVSIRGTCKQFAKTVKARGYSVQNGDSSASGPGSKGDVVAAAGKEYPRIVSRMSTGGDVVLREAPHPEDVFNTPRQTGRARGMRAARRSFDEEDYATANLRHSQQKPATVNSGAGAPSALTTIALASIPLLLIAPVMGFIARCVVDYIHVHIEREVSKRFAEMESLQSLQARRRPRVKRWQTILDEDRDEDKPEEPLKSSAISEYQYESDPWSMNARQRATEDTAEVDSWQEKEVDAERKIRHKNDYEQIKRSYTRLEPMYEKFLADSGLTSSGYWRGASES